MDNQKDINKLISEIEENKYINWIKINYTSGERWEITIQGSLVYLFNMKYPNQNDTNERNLKTIRNKSLSDGLNEVVELLKE